MRRMAQGLEPRARDFNHGVHGDTEMIHLIHDRMKRAIASGLGVRLTFQEVSLLLSDYDRLRSTVGGSSGELTMASIMETALTITSDERVLTGLSRLLTLDVTVDLALNEDKELMRQTRRAMLTAGVYPSENVEVKEILSWIKLLKGKPKPFTPFAIGYVQALIRTFNHAELLAGTKKSP